MHFKENFMSSQTTIEQFQNMMAANQGNDLMKALRTLMSAQDSILWVNDNPRPLAGWASWNPWS
jgi:hypothetical protein